MKARYRLGIDIGGTFTDASLVDEETGEVRIAKVLSTPADPSLGFMAAVDRIVGTVGLDPAAVRYVVHATTVATNAIIEGKVARTGFVTTAGFRDMLEIARQIRPSLYDTQFEKPTPLVPRYLCFEAPERLDARGRVLQPLDDEAVYAVAAHLRDERVESVAVCLLHAYLNPVHERRVGEILREELPGVIVSLSSEVAPEFREYTRASTTVINATVRPIVSRYLERIGERLEAAGFSGDLLVMQSSGGVFSASAARERPVFMVESGPAAGVIAATALGESLGFPDLISFDMGGTTAKVGLVQDGAPRITKDYQVGASARAGVTGMGASGYPIRTPVIDLVEIGAGGGSIAWVDSGGMLRVGPRSAGADPGPVCYGRGGTEPTVTDANLVLGRLNPDFFLGGEMTLDVEGARRAIEEHCAIPLTMKVIEAAHGIVEIANAAMVNALHLVSVQRGYDPRQFALVAFGGGGPLHANALAAETGMPLTIVPPSPGVFSSMGLLVTDLKREYTAALLSPVESLEGERVTDILDGLERQGREDLAREGIAPADMTFSRQTDTRYIGQSFELTVPLSPGAVDAAELSALLDRFHAEHHRAYGYSAPGEPVEIVNLRLTAVGRLVRPRLHEVHEGAGDALTGRRPVYVDRQMVECPVYDRVRLGVGDAIEGPAIVEEMDSTTVIYPHYRAEVDRFGNLLIQDMSVPEDLRLRARGAASASAGRGP